MYGWTGTCLSHYFLKSLSIWKNAMTVKGMQFKSSKGGILSFTWQCNSLGIREREKQRERERTLVAKAGVSGILRHKLHSGRSQGVKRY